MHLLKTIKKLVYRHLQEMRWQALVALLLIYYTSSWLLLTLAGEHHLTDQNFLYWLIITSSTVGYGDLSPETAAGRAIVALYIVPAGLGVFAMAVGRLAAFVAYQWRKGTMGLKQLNLTDHILVIGWNDKRTLNLLRLLETEAKNYRNRTICLCVAEELDNPMPGRIEFVRAESFNDNQSMRRACAEDASTIIIDCPRDEETLSTALNIYNLNKSAHIIAYFRDDNLSQLLKQHCPSVECTPSVSTELLVKSAMDPGSGMLHQEMLDAGEGMTQYSVIVPEDVENLTVKDLYVPLKRKYDATLLAVGHHPGAHPDINPPLDQRIYGGGILYYLASRRIKEFDWDDLSQSPEE